MGGGTCFAQAVALLYWDLYSLVDGFDQLLRQRRSARTQHSEGTEIITVDRGVFGKKQDDRWHDVRISDPVVLYYGTDLFEIEFWHDGDSESNIEGLMYESDQG